MFVGCRLLWLLCVFFCLLGVRYLLAVVCVFGLLAVVRPSWVLRCSLLGVRCAFVCLNVVVCGLSLVDRRLAVWLSVVCCMLDIVCGLFLRFVARCPLLFVG